jgi:hypothetical protein
MRPPLCFLFITSCALSLVPIYLNLCVMINLQVLVSANSLNFIIHSCYLYPFILRFCTNIYCICNGKLISNALITGIHLLMGVYSNPCDDKLASFRVCVCKLSELGLFIVSIFINLFFMSVLTSIASVMVNLLVDLYLICI